MKILILTQKVDKTDPILGFMHNWIREFAKEVESVEVVCLFEGEHDLPKNIVVHSLGKEVGSSRLKYLFRFYRYIFSLRKNYDNVFVHMNQIYVILGWPVWKILNKKIGLWYAHGSVSTSLRIAEKLADSIFTSTESGFRIKSKKKKVIGQGIDVCLFSPSLQKGFDNTLKILSVGRISQIKDYKTILEALVILSQEKVKFELEIIGAPIYKDDYKYEKSLKDFIKNNDLEEKVKMIGALPNDKIIEHLQNSDIFVNMGLTGSLDKAIVEAMSVGLPVLTCNEALRGILDDKYIYEKGDFKQLADKIKELDGLGFEGRKSVGLENREIVIREHSLSNFVRKIISLYE